MPPSELVRERELEIIENVFKGIDITTYRYKSKYDDRVSKLYSR